MCPPALVLCCPMQTREPKIQRERKTDTERRYPFV